MTSETSDFLPWNYQSSCYRPGKGEIAKPLYCYDKGGRKIIPNPYSQEQIDKLPSYGSPAK